MHFTISFRTGKDGELVYGERPQFREEFLQAPYENINIKATLGQMFMDFISLDGIISDSNHPFVQVAGDTCEGATSESYFYVTLKDYIDLGISNKEFFEEPCFMYFIEQRNLRLPAHGYTYIKKEGMEDKDVEDYIDDNPDMTPVERTMRGYVAAREKLFDVPLMTYECDTVEDACVASLHFLITHNCNIKKCQNCGKYFIPASTKAKYCDRISPFNKRATCKEDGAQRTHIENVKNDSIADLVKSTKRKYYMRWYRDQSNDSLHEKYTDICTIVDEKDRLYQKGGISKEAFLTWLEKL